MTSTFQGNLLWYCLCCDQSHSRARGVASTHRGNFPTSQDDNGEQRILQGKKKTTSIRMVTTMQTKCSRRKGYGFFVLLISSNKGKYVEDAEVLNRYPILQQFQDVFFQDITDLPPHREVEFSTVLVLGATPTSKAPYRMSTPKFVELKLHLKEMLDKRYIRPNVSPWGEPM